MSKVFHFSTTNLRAFDFQVFTLNLIHVNFLNDIIYYSYVHYKIKMSGNV